MGKSFLNHFHRIVVSFHCCFVRHNDIRLTTVFRVSPCTNNGLKCNYPQGSLAQIGHSIICDVYNLHIQHAWDYMYYITHPLAILYDKRWLTHWGWMAHICVSKLNIIGSDNGLAPGRCQAIIRTNPGILLIGPSGTNFNESLMEIRPFSFKKMRLKVSSAKWRPFVSISMY